MKPNNSKSKAGGLWRLRSRKGNLRSMDSFVREQSNIYQYNEQRSAPREGNALPCGLFDPESSYKLAWDFVILALVVYYGFAVPFRLAFDLVNS